VRWLLETKGAEFPTKILPQPTGVRMRASSGVKGQYLKVPQKALEMLPCGKKCMLKRLGPRASETEWRATGVSKQDHPAKDLTREKKQIVSQGELRDDSSPPGQNGNP
jgi:hypothetical protein